jgi:hypothetical protein
MTVDFGPFQRPDPLPADNGPGTGHLLVLASADGRNDPTAVRVTQASPLAAYSACAFIGDTPALKSRLRLAGDRAASPSATLPRCVGQTPAAGEFCKSIGESGVGKTKSNVELHPVQSGRAEADRDATFAVKRIEL